MNFEGETNQFFRQIGDSYAWCWSVRDYEKFITRNLKKHHLLKYVFKSTVVVQLLPRTTCDVKPIFFKPRSLIPKCTRFKPIIQQVTNKLRYLSVLYNYIIKNSFHLTVTTTSNRSQWLTPYHYQSHKNRIAERNRKKRACITCTRKTEYYICDKW